MIIQCCSCNAQHEARRLIGWEASYQKQTGLDLGRRKILDHMNHHPSLQHPPTLYSSTCVAVQSRLRNQTVLCISNKEQYLFSCTSKQLPPGYRRPKQQYCSLLNSKSDPLGVQNSKTRTMPRKREKKNTTYPNPHQIPEKQGKTLSTTSKETPPPLRLYKTLLPSVELSHQGAIFPTHARPPLVQQQMAVCCRPAARCRVPIRYERVRRYSGSLRHTSILIRS